MNPLALLRTGVALVVLAGGTSLLLSRRPRFADLALRALVPAGLGACAAAAVLVLTSGGRAGDSLLPPVPGGLWTIALDPLSAWFLLLLCCVGAPATIYGTSFLAPARGERPVAVSHALLTLLLAAMIVVLAAQAVVLFMLAWETMALSACLLIIYEPERPEVRRAGLLYLVMTHVSALALLAMFLLWGRGRPDLTFQSLARVGPDLSWAGAAILLLALLGFGGKAGMVPLHIWVPGADAAEPSHVSAVLSGVMLKMGIYGLLRVLSLVGQPPAWFGWTLCGLGLGSGVLGVLWALGQQDLKRLLAYSSVENVGIILLGMGVGVLGLAYGHPLVALLGLTGALLHSLNHALFKSLLFLGAGAVLRATGSRRLEELGGLGRDLPWTAVAFAVGSVAIVGLPPLNGFVSEWVAVQGLLAGAREPGPLALLVLGVAGLGLIGALALACFTRVLGSVFLGQPRRLRGPVREEWGLIGPMMALASMCVLLGMVPSLVVEPAFLVVRSLTNGASASAEAGAFRDGLAAQGVFIGLLAGVIGLLLGIRQWVSGARRARTGTTWSGGYSHPVARMQYSAASFTSPARLAFGMKQERGVHPERVDRSTDLGVGRLWHWATALAAAFRPLQQGPITRHLQYIVLTVLVLLGVLFVSLARHL